MEMERFNGKAKEEDQGAVPLVLDLAKGFERVSLLVVWAWGTRFSFPRKILRVLCGYFEYHGHFARIQAELLAIPHFVLQDALSEAMKIYPPLKLRVFVDDITALAKGRNKEVVEMAKKVMQKLKEEVEKKGL